jgi:hypothetical protein
MFYNGFAIIEDRFMVDRYQARTHRKKRINKKWAKRYGFREVPKKTVIMVGNKVVMHPATAAEFRRRLASQDKG